MDADDRDPGQHWLRRASARAGDAAAIAVAAEAGVTRVVGYAELLACATAAASAWQAAGIGAGDRVALLADDPVAVAIAVHAALLAGATFVPLHARLTDAELAAVLTDADCARVEADAAGLTRARRIVDAMPAGSRPAVGAGPIEGSPPTACRAPSVPYSAVAPALLVYTSGSTGRAKGVVLTAGALYASARASALNLGEHAGDRWLACMPLYHIGGLSILLRATIATANGASTSVHALSRFDADAAYCALIDGDAPVTLASMVPTMLARVFDIATRAGHLHPPVALRAILLGGGPIPRELLHRAVDTGWPVLPTYGMTESASQIATMPLTAPPNRRRESGAQPLEGVAIKIEPIAVAPGSDSVGEILVRGPMLMREYWRRPDETAHALLDGWFHTGDLGTLDDDGYLHVLGRADDVVVSGGENVMALEVEQALRELPGVRDVAVVGVDDATWGRAVAAALVLDDDASIETILDTFPLARHKRPRRVCVVPAIPRTTLGKPDRRAVAALFVDDTRRDDPRDP